ncbi:MAG: hypothetical protein EWV73_07305 [Microcystis wesenbergii Mw_QC_B_20070930_S4D]|nr:MAG: hypothetical protein EWV73_07305 [Microcystis wesenbergii Mw_QC_B_20070930_S4D]
MISLTYIGSINLCVLCVFVVRSRLSLGGMYLRIHFTHQIQESLIVSNASVDNHILLTKDYHILNHYENAVWD